MSVGLRQKPFAWSPGCSNLPAPEFSSARQLHAAGGGIYIYTHTSIHTYSREFKEEYKKIHKDAVEYTTPIIKALNELPVYYRYHIKKGLALGKGLKIVRYQSLL